MTGKHYALIAACLASIGTMVGSLNDWGQATRPLFVGGLIGAISAVIGAIYTDKP